MTRGPRLGRRAAQVLPRRFPSLPSHPPAHRERARAHLVENQKVIVSTKAKREQFAWTAADTFLQLPTPNKKRTLRAFSRDTDERPTANVIKGPLRCGVRG